MSSKIESSDTTTVSDVLAVTGWRPIYDDLGCQLEVILEVRGDKTAVQVVEGCQSGPLVSLTPDGADELAEELRVFAATARAAVVRRSA